MLLNYYFFVVQRVIVSRKWPACLVPDLGMIKGRVFEALVAEKRVQLMLL